MMSRWGISFGKPSTSKSGDLPRGIDLEKWKRIRGKPKLLKTAVLRAETDFYRSSLMLTREFLKSEMEA
jgi:hypothetical protein